MTKIKEWHILGYQGSDGPKSEGNYITIYPLLFLFPSFFGFPAHFSPSLIPLSLFLLPPLYPYPFATVTSANTLFVSLYAYLGVRHGH